MFVVPAPVSPPAGPFAPRELAAGHVHVWHADLDVSAPDESLLAPEERARAERMLGKARHRFVRSRELLRRLVGAYAGTAPEAVELRIGAEGKPRLAAGSLRFSLAHSGAAWVAAFAVEREVGVDVERLDRDVDRERVAARIFAPREIETIHRLQGPAKTLAFFRCWTVREAIVKARGEGMFTLAARFEVDADPDHPLTIHPLGSEAERFRVGEVPARSGCCAALATEGDPSRILAFEIASD
ncbi:MAG: 4'-phosphopantetheinyl transferase superfamily protein [bacterium]